MPGLKSDSYSILLKVPTSTPVSIDKVVRGRLFDFSPLVITLLVRISSQFSKKSLDTYCFILF